jgi:hypothetical protein
MIADIWETRAAQTTPGAAARSARRFSLMFPARIWGSLDTYLGVIEMARFIKWKGDPKR